MLQTLLKKKDLISHLCFLHIFLNRNLFQIAISANQWQIRESIFQSYHFLLRQKNKQQTFRIKLALFFDSNPVNSYNIDKNVKNSWKMKYLYFFFHYHLTFNDDICKLWIFERKQKSTFFVCKWQKTLHQNANACKWMYSLFNITKIWCIKVDSFDELHCYVPSQLSQYEWLRGFNCCCCSMFGDAKNHSMLDGRID